MALQAVRGKRPAAPRSMVVVQVSGLLGQAPRHQESHHHHGGHIPVKDGLMAYRLEGEGRVFGGACGCGQRCGQTASHQHAMTLFSHRIVGNRRGARKEERRLACALPFATGICSIFFVGLKHAQTGSPAAAPTGAVTACYVFIANKNRSYWTKPRFDTKKPGLPAILHPGPVRQPSSGARGARHALNRVRGSGRCESCAQPRRAGRSALRATGGALAG